jgi:hypothetical protein
MASLAVDAPGPGCSGAEIRSQDAKSGIGVPGEQHRNPQMVIAPLAHVAREPLLDPAIAPHPPPPGRAISPLHSAEPARG